VTGWYSALRSNGHGPASVAMSLGQYRRHGRWSELAWAEVEMGRLIDCAEYVDDTLTGAEAADLVRATSSEPNQWDYVVSESLAHKTRQVLATLTPREEKVIRMRFGIGEPTDCTLEEVATEFGVSRERIRQIEAKAIRKLRHPERASRLRDFADEGAPSRPRLAEQRPMPARAAVQPAEVIGSTARTVSDIVLRGLAGAGRVLITGLRFCASGNFNPTGYALVGRYEPAKEAA
jgi:RNA polymerase sigma factor (sigma-70 family)